MILYSAIFSINSSKLTRRGVPGYIVKLLSYWYAKQTMRFRWGDCISSPFRVSNRMRQGGISYRPTHVTCIWMTSAVFLIVVILDVCRRPLCRTIFTPMYTYVTCCGTSLFGTELSLKLKVAFRMMHNLPTYYSASEMFSQQGGRL